MSSMKSRRKITGPWTFDTRIVPLPWNGTTDITLPALPTGTNVWLWLLTASNNLASGTSGTITVTKRTSNVVLSPTIEAALAGPTDYLTSLYSFTSAGETAVRVAQTGGTAGGTAIGRLVAFPRVSTNRSAGGATSGSHSPITSNHAVAVGSPVFSFATAWKGTAGGSHPLSAAGSTPTQNKLAQPFLSQNVGGISQQIWYDIATSTTYNLTVSDTDSADWMIAGWLGSTT